MRIYTAVDNQNIASGATYTGPIFRPSFIDDEDGIFQVGTYSGIGAASFALQGRLTASAPWVTIVLNSAGDTSTADAGYFLVPMFPEMRVTVGASGGNVTGCNAWIGD